MMTSFLLGGKHVCCVVIAVPVLLVLTTTNNNNMIGLQAVVMSSRRKCLRELTRHAVTDSEEHGCAHAEQYWLVLYKLLIEKLQQVSTKSPKAGHIGIFGRQARHVRVPCQMPCPVDRCPIDVVVSCLYSVQCIGYRLPQKEPPMFSKWK